MARRIIPRGNLIRPGLTIRPGRTVRYNIDPSLGRPQAGIPDIAIPELAEQEPGLGLPRRPGLGIPDVEYIPDPGIGIPEQNIPGLGLPRLEPIPGIDGGNPNQGDKKRKIKLSQNNLDPLSSYYFSRAKYGDRNRVRRTNPIVDSENILDYYTDERELTKVSWSLAPFGNSSEAPRQTSPSSLLSFYRALGVRQLLPEQYYSSLFYSGNQYIHIDKPTVGANPVFRSFAREMMEALLTTSQRILSSISASGRLSGPTNQELVLLRNRLTILQQIIRTIPINDRERESVRRELEEVRNRILQLEEQEPDAPERVALTNAAAELDSIRIRSVRQLNPPSVLAEEDPEISFFFDQLETSSEEAAFGEGNFAQEIFDYRQRVRQRVIDNSEDVSLLQIVKEIDTSISRDQISRPSEKQINRYLLAQAFYPLVSIQSLTNSLNEQQSLYEYTSRYVEFDTPYVTNRDTHEFLEELSVPNFSAKIESNYNYYTKQYESITMGVDERAQTNSNVLERYSTLASQVLQRSATQNIKLKQLKSFVSLNERVPDYSDFGQFSQDKYYNFYASALEQIDDENLAPFVSKNQSIILPSSETQDQQIFMTESPMSLGIEFHREDESSLQTAINNLNLFPFNRTDFSQVMFENINQTSESEQRTQVLYSSEYLSSTESGLAEVESDYLPLSLRNISFADAVSPLYISEDSDESLVYNTEMNSLVVSGDAILPSEDQLGIIEEYVNNRAQEISSNAQSYLNIFSGKSSPSDVLGHRITKSSTEGEIVQNFYIGNNLNNEQMTYHDSQIKYGSEYLYELFEYRLIYGTKLKFNILPAVGLTIPTWFLNNYFGLRRGPTQGQIESAPNIAFDCYVDREPHYDVLEIPIYSQTVEAAVRNVNLIEPLTQSELISSISYPVAKVLDYPPTPPILNIFPLLGNNSQVKINSMLQAGEYLGDESLEIVSIGELEEQTRIVKEYQDNFKNYFLPPDKLSFRNEGMAEVRNIILYRTTSIDLEVQEYNDIYTSFDPQFNPDVVVRRYTTMQDEDNIDATKLLSYDILENLSPNVNYYYTCVVQDVHNNPSNPSVIYRVRLLLDKGLLIPEIEVVNQVGDMSESPTLDLTRYLQIEASGLQSDPYEIFNEDTNSLRGVRSAGQDLGDSIENQSYIIRLTSKDTGRKFDIKLNFLIRVNDQIINRGT